MSQDILERALQHKLIQLQQKFALITKAYSAKCQLLIKKQAIIQQLNHKIIQLEQKLSTTTNIPKHVPISYQKENQIQQTQQTITYNHIPQFCSWQSQNYQNVFLPKINLLQKDKNHEQTKKQEYQQKYQQSLITSSICQVPQNNKQNLPNFKIPTQTIHPFNESENISIPQYPSNKKSIYSQKRINTEGEQGKLKELHQIWEQRDQELGKMDQLFESLRERLKDYQ